MTADPNPRRRGRPPGSKNRPKPAGQAVRPGRPTIAEEQAAGYATKKADAARKSRELSQAGREIGDLPAVVDPARREACRLNLRMYLETYHAMTFTRNWSPDHLDAIADIERVALHGGLMSLAMPRGNGKSSLAEDGSLWAGLYGHRRFVPVIGPTEAHAVESLESVKAELEGNDLLLEDFPEVCFPIRKLEGIANRCSGQTHDGLRTHITWTATKIVLPTIEGSAASGVILRVAGLTGRIRGMKHKRSDGSTARPDLVIIDDPQTDESARSLTQCASRERLVTGAVLGLAGPGEKIAAIMLVTVIRPGDLADVFLDQQEHPEWNGRRTKLVYEFPTATKLWEEYAEKRANSLREHHDIRDATAFYAAHREAMDAGARVAWPERFNPDELSALQHAMNIRFQDERAFWAEYQNEPLPESEIESEDKLDVDELCQRVNGHPRGVVPIGCDYLTAFTDCHASLLFWCVVAWRPDFTGFVIDYGTHPDQKRDHFTLADAKPTLMQLVKGAAQEGAVRAGLDALDAWLYSREFRKEGGGIQRIGQGLIDSGWKPDVVYAFCRASANAAVLRPSRGASIRAASKPMDEYKKQHGDRVGHHWRQPNTRGKRAIPCVVVDVNYWKSFVAQRLSVKAGDRGSLTLWGKDPRAHKLLAQHLTAEYSTRVEANGHTVNEWAPRADTKENHWWDCLVGNAAAASMLGCALSETSAKAAGKPRAAPISMAALQQERRAKRQASL